MMKLCFISNIMILQTPRLDIYVYDSFSIRIEIKALYETLSSDCIFQDQHLSNMISILF